MNLLKAIGILKIEEFAFPHKGSEDWYDAVRLGIEALEREQVHRSGLRLTKPELLPGETSEDKDEPT